MTKANAGLLSLLAGALTSTVAAMPVTFYRGGQVASVDSALDSSFDIGDRFSGSYAFVSLLSDLDPSQDFGAHVGLMPFSLEIADRAYANVGTFGLISVRGGAGGLDADEPSGTGVSGRLHCLTSHPSGASKSRLRPRTRSAKTRCRSLPGL